jgi:hypothetical protein
LVISAKKKNGYLAQNVGPSASAHCSEVFGQWM